MKTAEDVLREHGIFDIIDKKGLTGLSKSIIEAMEEYAFHMKTANNEVLEKGYDSDTIDKLIEARR